MRYVFSGNITKMVDMTSSRSRRITNSRKTLKKQSTATVKKLPLTISNGSLSISATKLNHLT